VPPVIKEGSAVVTAHLGQDAVLPCEAEGDTAPNVMWRKDGFPLIHDNNKYVVINVRQSWCQSTSNVAVGFDQSTHSTMPHVLL